MAYDTRVYVGFQRASTSTTTTSIEFQSSACSLLCMKYEQMRAAEPALQRFPTYKQAK